MISRVMITTATALMVFAMGTSYAQEKSKQEHPAKGDQSTTSKIGHPTTFSKATDLIGFDVKNPQGENLGDVKDLLVDMNQERVGFIIVSYGGFLGIGDKLHAVPWDAVTVSTAEKRATVRIDKEKLKTAPGFNKDVWPNSYDENWAREVSTFYGCEPYWAHGGDAAATAGEHVKTDGVLRLFRASKIMDLKVENTAGENLGEVEDLAIEGEHGRVLYAVLSYGGVLGVGEKLFAVPIEAFEVKNDGKGLVLDVDKEKLKNAPGFDKKDWPDMANPRWTTEIYKYYNRKPYWERGKSPSD